MIDETPKITAEVNENLTAISGDQIAESLKNINEWLKLLGKRLKDVETYVAEIPTPSKTFYKPKGYEDYLNLSENFTEIYKRLDKIDGMQN